MKYLYWGGGLLIVIAVALFLYQNIKKNEPPVIEDIKPETVATALVTPLALDVSLAAPGTTNFTLIATTTPVSDGSSIKTSASGRAIVARESAILSSLDNSTEITLNLTPDKKESKINLLVGKVWSRVGRALEQDETFSVYTPTMVAAVRGTSFGVTLEPNRSLMVTEGTVYATQRNKETGELIASSTVAVMAGFVLEDDGTTFKIRPLTDKDKDEWYQLHTVETTKVEAGRPGGTTAPTVFETFNQLVSSTPPPAATPGGTTPTPDTTPNISSVTPKRFDPAQVDVVRVYGTNLSSTKEIRLNGAVAEFLITSAGVVVVNTSEFRDGYKSYDLTLTTAGGTDTVPAAFIMEQATVQLSISSASFTYDQSQNQLIVIRGSGFKQTDAVRVQNEPMQFTVVSDSEIRVPYATPETTVTVEVTASGQTARATVGR